MQFPKEVLIVAKGPDCRIVVSDWNKRKRGDEVEVTPGDV